MMNKSLILGLFFCGIVTVQLHAQDPIFSQFYSSPLSINPALAGNSNANWRIAGNQRDQWIASGIETLNTTSITVECKLFKQSRNDNPRGM
jgi:hypothetical protein